MNVWRFLSQRWWSLSIGACACAMVMTDQKATFSPSAAWPILTALMAAGLVVSLIGWAAAGGPARQ